MGNQSFLQKPITDKTTHSNQHEKFIVTSCEMQGWRRYMEDAYIVHCSVPGFQDIALFGVFDGHGGNECAQFAAKHFMEGFVKRPGLKEGNIAQALSQTFLFTELSMKMKPSILQMKKYKEKCVGRPVTQAELQSGCTAVVVAVTKEKYICANAGDSRAALCRKDGVQALSQDHKPENPIQKERIQKAGVQIIQGRVNGLNLTRSLGDFSHKQVPGIQFNQQPITCHPQIKEFDRKADDEFLLIGCDGIWEKYGDDSVQLTEQFRTSIKQKKQSKTTFPAKQALIEFFNKNINPGDNTPFGRDNMTALIIEFKHLKMK